MNLLPESVIGNGPAMSKAILSNGAPTLYSFIRPIASCSGPLARCTCRTFSTPSLNIIPGIYSVEAFAYFSQSLVHTKVCADVPPWISCRTSFTRHLGEPATLSPLPHRHFPTHVSRGRFLL
jgi:hypothetical protein